MSTASGAADNEIFNALRIEEIRDILSPSLVPGPTQLRIFYGSGNAPGANALEVRDGSLGLVRRNVADASPFTPTRHCRYSSRSVRSPAAATCWYWIGHGNPDGAGMWSSPTPLSPASLRALHEHQRR